MDYQQIDRKVLKVFQECAIHSFPFDCFQVLYHYQFKIMDYIGLYLKNSEIYQIASAYSEDAFTYENKICFNHMRPKARIRFSLMHELGHYKLEHKGPHTALQEQEANCFASHILAPRMAIHYSRLRDSYDVARLFRISQESAQYALKDYSRWHRLTAYGLRSVDREMYRHFYKKELQGFVWNEKPCPYCGKPIYNQPEERCCPLCQVIHPLSDSTWMSEREELFRTLHLPY
ncbi:ImmA/IrrE family metallo-endopeptidase [Lachnoclostridium edouardi]|uniref:ImmA/IrrE family metallo-endopeptidase n=1 Tax=Lachnoclostridium edouardi TaxID=1926283 RepID=UPI000C7D5A52|nr:ImmA/IrrE family metallo-endopeptidase [Lachnoclostridium edouardi]